MIVFIPPLKEYIIIVTFFEEKQRIIILLLDILANQEIVQILELLRKYRTSYEEALEFFSTSNNIGALSKLSDYQLHQLVWVAVILYNRKVTGGK